MKEQTSVSNPFRSSQSSSVSGNEGNSIFGGSVTQTATPQNLFAGSNSTPSFGSIFGGQPQTTSNTGSIFGGSPPTTFGKQSIFGGHPVPDIQNMFSPSENQSSFTSSLSTADHTQNLFSNASIGNSGSLGNSGNFSSQTTPSTPIFAAQSMLYQPRAGNSTNQNIVFGGSSSSSNGSLTFQTPGKSEKSIFTSNNLNTPNGFGSSHQHKAVAIDHAVYSKPEDITTEELRAFAAATFAFGKIPLKPPPLESCKQYILN